MLFIVDGTRNNNHHVVVAKLGKDINIHIKEKSTQFGKKWHGLHKINWIM